jgi:general stress protein CsbA
VDNATLITGAKWVGAAVAVVVIAIALYLGAVLSVYIIAWVIDLIGIIFD